ncbi:MAG: alginate lyase family protein, partial [Ferruginibacter sp.]|nr:alginate lyase family protein [Chitinophagaceae bacterium]
VNTGRGAGMIDVRHFVKVVDGIGLIQGSKYWTAADQQGMKKWFSDFLDWMQTSKNGMEELNAGNNHGAWYEALRLSLALYTNNKDLVKKSLLKAQERLDQQMDDAGSFPKEMERTTSLHYTTFAMEAFFNIANMSDDAGTDLWNYTSPSGKSLKKGFDVLRPYLVKEKEWQGQQIKNFEYEEGYFLLAEAARRFNCKNCREEVKTLAGEKTERLRINLLY